MWSMVGDHPIAGLTVDHSGPDSRRQTGEIWPGSSCPIEPVCGRGARRHTSSPSRTGHLQNTESNVSLQFKEKARDGLADTSRASPLECLRVGLGPNCRSHRDCATLKSMASARSQMPNGIYLYLYQISEAEVEFIRVDQRHDRVSRNHSMCFRPTRDECRLAMAQPGLRGGWH